MPVATVEGLETERFDLVTAPPDGYVVVRRMTYGEYLKRQQMTSNMKISANRQSDYAGVMELLNKHAIEYEFANCIVEHNLEKQDGTRLDFKKAGDIDLLASKIGNEISTRINEVNAFDEVEEGNSNSASSSESEHQDDQEPVQV